MFEIFPRYEHLNNLKINSLLKILLAVGGWNLASVPFTKMVATGPLVSVVRTLLTIP